MKKNDEKKVDVDKPSNHAKIKTIKLFLASSSELKDDRMGVEIWVRRENDRLVKKGYYLNLRIWEDFIDAVSRTRLQDEYNNEVAQCDIVICLFATKVGKYTEEEFEVAYNNFIEKGKPKYIYTYFKVVTISTMDMNMEIIEDLTSLVNFKKKLHTNLEHNYKQYKSTEDLKWQLKNQLEKILEEMS